MSHKIESKCGYESQEDINEDNLEKLHHLSPSSSNANVFSAKQSIVFNRLYNDFEVSKAKRDRSLKCIHHTVEEDKILQQNLQKLKDKRCSSATKQTRPNDNFYGKMKKLEEKRNRKMLLLIIDKEK